MSKTKACEQVEKTKTSILVVEKGNIVSEQLCNNIKNAGLSSFTKIHRTNAKNSIKNHDIYVVNCNELTQEEQLKAIRKMHKSNPGATLFCIGNNCKKESIEKESEKFTYPINMIENSTAISEHISCIENVKRKILSMWDKLDKT